MKNYPLYNSPYSTDLKELLARAVNTYGDKPIFVFRRGGRNCEITYREFNQTVGYLGASLETRGLLGTPCAILGENSWEWLLSYFTIGCGGGVAVPLDREQTVESLLDMLLATRSKTLFFSADYADVVQELRPGLPKDMRYIAFAGQKAVEEAELLEDLVLEGRNAPNQVAFYRGRAVCAEDLLEIIFTSGTTSVSKAVMLTHHNVVSNACYSANMVDIRSTDRVLAPLPFNHTYQLTCGILNMINQGCTIIINSSIRRLMEDITSFSPTIVVVVPLMLEMVLQKIRAGIQKQGKEAIFGKLLGAVKFLRRLGFRPDMSAMRKVRAQLGGQIHTFICGGAPLSSVVVEDFNAMGMQVVQGYGITECSPLVAVNRNRCFKVDSVGLPIPGCEVKIDNGEILVRGEGVMAGYYNNEEETSGSFTDGWYRTGDLGRLDASGFLYITGRKKNVIVMKNGKNVSPEELEEELYSCPLIKECVVYGVESGANADLTLSVTVFPDFENDQLQGMENHEVLSRIDEEIQKINKRLPLYKQVRNIKLRETEFEKTTTKKIKRANIK